MIEMLATAADTANQAPGAITTYGPWGILIAMGGWKGIAKALLWLQGQGETVPDRGTSSSEDRSKGVCPAHDGLVKLLDERNKFIHDELSEIKADIKTLLKK